MYENTKPVPHALNGRFSGGGTHESDLLTGEAYSATSDFVGEGDALHRIEWSELTARLNAVRDLRLALRNDANRGVDSASGSFADAASRYFRTREGGEADVNPVALEHRKCSPGIVGELDGPQFEEAHNQKHATSSDAREN